MNGKSLENGGTMATRQPSVLYIAGKGHGPAWLAGSAFWGAKSWAKICVWGLHDRFLYGISKPEHGSGFGLLNEAILPHPLSPGKEFTMTSTTAYGRNSSTKNRSSGQPRKPRTNVKTWAFDSVGTRKYALQIQKAANGNPCLRIVEGVPQDDGSFRKFDVTIWSEDFARLFATLDEARVFIEQNNIRTPSNHKLPDHRRKKPR